MTQSPIPRVLKFTYGVEIIFVVDVEDGVNCCSYCLGFIIKFVKFGKINYININKINKIKSLELL